MPKICSLCWVYILHIYSKYATGFCWWPWLSTDWDGHGHGSPACHCCGRSGRSASLRPQAQPTPARDRGPAVRKPGPPAGMPTNAAGTAAASRPESAGEASAHAELEPSFKSGLEHLQTRPVQFYVQYWQIFTYVNVCTILSNIGNITIKLYKFCPIPSNIMSNIMDNIYWQIARYCTQYMSILYNIACNVTC